MTGWMESVTGGEEFALSQEPARADLTSREEIGRKEVEINVCRCLIEVRRVVMVWQTSKSRFVYSLGPYIAAMISKGKRGAAGMARFCCSGRVRWGGGARDGREWERC